MSCNILILMRHAKPISDSGLEDFNIPLSKEGKENQKRLCQKLEKEGFSPNEVLASPFRRALETGAVVAHFFGIDCLPEEALGEPFNDEALIKRLQSCEGTIAFVGHGPSLTSMANMFLGNNHFKDILPKSSAVILEFNEVIKKGSAKLLNFTTIYLK